MCACKEQPYLGRRTDTSVWVLLELMTRYSQVNESGGFVVSNRDSIPAMGLSLLTHDHRHIGFWLQIRALREDRLA